jgi:hypothetical protein
MNFAFDVVDEGAIGKRNTTCHCNRVFYGDSLRAVDLADERLMEMENERWFLMMSSRGESEDVKGVVNVVECWEVLVVLGGTNCC